MINWTSRTRAALVALAVAMLVVPAALAKGKPPTTGPDCKPKVSVILKGTLVSFDVGASTFVMRVEKANKHGKTLVTDPPTNVTVKVNADTKIRRQGHATLTDFDIDPADRVMVQFRVCKQTIKDADTLEEWTNASAGILGTTFAKRVNAHPPKPPETEDGDD